MSRDFKPGVTEILRMAGLSQRGMFIPEIQNLDRLNGIRARGRASTFNNSSLAGDKQNRLQSPQHVHAFLGIWVHMQEKSQSVNT